MKKVLVTGATGFIGQWVVKELLKNDVDVIAVVRENSCKDILDKKVEIVKCNLNNIEKLPALIVDRDIDAVFHFAWQGVSDSDIRNEKIQMDNVLATLKLIEILPQIGCKRFIGAGSLHEIESFYDMKKDKRIDNLGYMYKAAKLSAHWMGKALAGSKDIDFFWPIISNAYGIGENSGRLINSVIRSVLMGEEPELSHGEQLYDFVYISDVARAFYLIGELGVDGVNYFIGSGQPKPLKDYLELAGSIINQMNSSNVSLGFGKKQSDVVFLPQKEFDISSLIRDVGFDPQVSFEEGILSTAKWIKAQMDA